MMEGIIGGVFILLVIFLTSRLAHYFNNTKIKLEEMDRKLDELTKALVKKD
ncbi:MULTISPECIES: hypothetical protein [Bacillus]|uniref:hypothetical protein n=1 Tax=Bacillus TaxID=1386 RepID=UPI0012FF4703|nr:MULTISPECIES: hypothetical protein [Bacillus]